MIHIAKFSANGVFYRSELRIDRDHIRYRVSEVAAPRKKIYRYFKVSVTKTFKKPVIYYTKVWYNYKVPRYNFVGYVDKKAVFRLHHWEDRIRFRKEPRFKYRYKTKTYVKTVRKRVFVPRKKFHEYRNSFEFSTWIPGNRDLIRSIPRLYTENFDKAHALLVTPYHLQEYDNTHAFGVVFSDAPSWFSDLWAISEVEGLLPEKGFCEVPGVLVDTESLTSALLEKCRRLDDWVKKNGLSDETKRFLSDELNNLPFISPLALPFFNRQSQIYSVDESNGVIGFNRGLSNLRQGYVNRFKSNVHGLTFLGESPEAFKTVLEIIQKILRVLVAARKGKFTEGLRILGLTSRKGVASDWLMLQYGIKPLISDLKTIAEESARRDTGFYTFRFREYREIRGNFPLSSSIPLKPIFDFNSYIAIEPDDKGEYELDAKCFNIAYGNTYDTFDPQEVNKLLPPVRHTYERLKDSSSDFSILTWNNEYSHGVYDHFWAKHLRFDEAANYAFHQRFKAILKEPTVINEEDVYVLQRKYVLRTRTPAKYKWWEVLKLDELDVAGWELLPFSFVLDWIIPIGNYLEELASLRTLPKNILFDLTIKDVVTHKPSGFQFSRCDRMRDIDSTKSAFLNLESISWDPLGHLNIDRLLNAVALLQQLKK